MLRNLRSKAVKNRRVYLIRREGREKKLSQDHQQVYHMYMNIGTRFNAFGIG